MLLAYNFFFTSQVFSHETFKFNERWANWTSLRIIFRVQWSNAFEFFRIIFIDHYRVPKNVVTNVIRLDYVFHSTPKSVYVLFSILIWLMYLRIFNITVCVLNCLIILSTYFQMFCVITITVWVQIELIIL